MGTAAVAAPIAASALATGSAKMDTGEEGGWFTIESIRANNPDLDEEQVSPPLNLYRPTPTTPSPVARDIRQHKRSRKYDNNNKAFVHPLTPLTPPPLPADGRESVLSRD